MVFHASRLLFSKSLRKNLIFTYSCTEREERNKDISIIAKNAVGKSVRNKTVVSQEEKITDVLHHSESANLSKNSSKFIVQNQLLSTLKFNEVLLKILNVVHK